MYKEIEKLLRLILSVFVGENISTVSLELVISITLPDSMDIVFLCHLVIQL